ncbi:MAG: sodium:solute symporter family protein, partial [Hymenobacteraceae bacterium]|nr:sodium:solute symporter family protein [Hymenobacteraceae bacterium]MDX5395949.1 sodium:solute symporter family protein [Hymenobacteraceae bacterium]MDX5512007.1 sodium:solute symporter family protein [Hymenobacteraceae bacterium]
QGMFSELGFATAASMDAEMGLPLLLRSILPVGLMGLMLSSYFSAILSTADSCLMAASGNLLTDILSRFMPLAQDDKRQLRLSQLLTLGLGIVAILLASAMENVLELMLYSYAFMVSGLLVPLVAAVFFKKSNSAAALMAMAGGGITTVSLTILAVELPFGLDANIFGLTASLLLFIAGENLFPQKRKTKRKIRKPVSNTIVVPTLEN